MKKLAKVLKEFKFDEDDARAMDEVIRKVDALIEALRTEEPSPSSWDYEPILSLALLNLLAKMEKQTNWLIVLTCVLGALAVIQIVLFFI